MTTESRLDTYLGGGGEWKKTAATTAPQLHWQQGGGQKLLLSPCVTAAPGTQLACYISGWKSMFYFELVPCESLSFKCLFSCNSAPVCAQKCLIFLSLLVINAYVQIYSTVQNYSTSWQLWMTEYDELHQYLVFLQYMTQSPKPWHNIPNILEILSMLCISIGFWCFCFHLWGSALSIYKNIQKLFKLQERNKYYQLWRKCYLFVFLW